MKYAENPNTFKKYVEKEVVQKDKVQHKLLVKCYREKLNLLTQTPIFCRSIIQILSAQISSSVYDLYYSETEPSTSKLLQTLQKHARCKLLKRFKAADADGEKL